MPIHPDTWIRRLALEEGMIEPFEPEQVRDGVVSYGLSSFGYDIRVDRQFRLPRPGVEGVLDPKAPPAELFDEIEADHIDLPARSFVLARTVERFRIPRGVLALCTGKSTYSRCGVVLNTTPFEPEWEGTATIQIANLGPHPVRIHAGEGIGQMLFFEGSEACETSYADKRGKYQGQEAVTPSRV